MKYQIRWLAIVVVILALVVITLVVIRFRGRHPAGGQITIEFYNDWGGVSTVEGSGWFAQIIQEQFNMTINYLGSSEMEQLFQSRRAAGDLGDLIIFGTHRLREAVNEGLLMDITQLVENRMHYYPSQFPGAIDRARHLTLTDSIFALPIQVSTQSSTNPNISGTVPLSGAFLRQDAYMAVGAPTLNVMENLLTVLADMQLAVPYTETGLRTYGFSLYSGLGDDTILYTAAAFATLVGGMERFSSTSFISFENQLIESFLDDSGMYLRTLKLYFDANQAGILDPASAFQSRQDVWDKFEQGAVLFSWWPWPGMQTFNTPGRVNQGIGYNFIPIMNQRIHHGYNVAPASPSGPNRINPSGPNRLDMVIGIGANAEHPERIIDFIDWMASPEGHQTIVAGPEGLTWVMVDGAPALTDFGISAGVHTTRFNDIEVPAEWGGGMFNRGAWQGNITVILDHYGREMNPVTGFPYSPRLWPVENAGGTRLQTEWAARFGSNTPLDFVLDNNMIVTPPAVNFEMPMDSAEIRAMRDAIRPVLEEASWRMIFAADETEFFQIWMETQARAYEMGWSYVFEHDSAAARYLFALQ